MDLSKILAETSEIEPDDPSSFGSVKVNINGVEKVIMVPLDPKTKAKVRAGQLAAKRTPEQASIVIEESDSEDSTSPSPPVSSSSNPTNSSATTASTVTRQLSLSPSPIVVAPMEEFNSPPSSSSAMDKTGVETPCSDNSSVLKYSRPRIIAPAPIINTNVVTNPVINSLPTLGQINQTVNLTSISSTTTLPVTSSRIIIIAPSQTNSTASVAASVSTVVSSPTILSPPGVANQIIRQTATSNLLSGLILTTTATQTQPTVRLISPSNTLLLQSNVQPASNQQQSSNNAAVRLVLQNTSNVFQQRPVNSLLIRPPLPTQPNSGQSIARPVNLTASLIPSSIPGVTGNAVGGINSNQPAKQHIRIGNFIYEMLPTTQKSCINLTLASSVSTNTLSTATSLSTQVSSSNSNQMLIPSQSLCVTDSRSITSSTVSAKPSSMPSMPNLLLVSKSISTQKTTASTSIATVALPKSISSNLPRILNPSSRVFSNVSSSISKASTSALTASGTTSLTNVSSSVVPNVIPTTVPFLLTLNNNMLSQTPDLLTGGNFNHFSSQTTHSTTSTNVSVVSSSAKSSLTTTRPRNVFETSGLNKSLSTVSQIINSNRVLDSLKGKPLKSPNILSSPALKSKKAKQIEILSQKQAILPKPGIIGATLASNPYASSLCRTTQYQPLAGNCSRSAVSNVSKSTGLTSKNNEKLAVKVKSGLNSPENTYKKEKLLNRSKVTRYDMFVKRVKRAKSKGVSPRHSHNPSGANKHPIKHEIKMSYAESVQLIKLFDRSLNPYWRDYKTCTVQINRMPEGLIKDKSHLTSTHPIRRGGILALISSLQRDKPREVTVTSKSPDPSARKRPRDFYNDMSDTFSSLKNLRRSKLKASQRISAVFKKDFPEVSESSSNSDASCESDFVEEDGFSHRSSLPAKQVRRGSSNPDSNVLKELTSSSDTNASQSCSQSPQICSQSPQIRSQSPQIRFQSPQTSTVSLSFPNLRNALNSKSSGHVESEPEIGVDSSAAKSDLGQESHQPAPNEKTTVQLKTKTDSKEPDSESESSSLTFSLYKGNL